MAAVGYRRFLQLAVRTVVAPIVSQLAEAFETLFFVIASKALESEAEGSVGARRSGRGKCLHCPDPSLARARSGRP